MDTYRGGKWKKEISIQISGPDNSVNWTYNAGGLWMWKGIDITRRANSMKLLWVLCH